MQNVFWHFIYGLLFFLQLPYKLLSIEENTPHQPGFVWSIATEKEPAHFDFFFENCNDNEETVEDQDTDFFTDFGLENEYSAHICEISCAPSIFDKKFISTLGEDISLYLLHCNLRI